MLAGVTFHGGFFPFFQDNYNGKGHDFKAFCMCNDEDKLITGSENGRIIAWKFTTAYKLCELNLNKLINHIAIIKWPIIATVICDQNQSYDEFNCVRIFDILTEKIIREIPFPFLKWINITSDILMVHIYGILGGLDNNFKNFNGMIFWSLSEIMNTKQIETENLKHRKMKIHPDPSYSRILINSCVTGSYVITNEAHNLVKRNFWP